MLAKKPTLVSLFRVESGQKTMTNLYGYFIPDAKNYKRQLDVQFDRLVPGSMIIDGKNIDYRDEFDNPPEFISRLIMMCDDIE